MERKNPIVKRARNWIATIPSPPYGGSELLYLDCVKKVIEFNNGRFAGQVECGGLTAYNHIQAGFFFEETKSLDQIKVMEANWKDNFQGIYAGDSPVDGTQMIIDDAKFDTMFFQSDQYED